MDTKKFEEPTIFIMGSIEDLTIVSSNVRKNHQAPNWVKRFSLR